MQAVDKRSGEVCAVKVYDVTQLGKLNKAQLIREIKLHGSFAHRNIVELWCSFQVRLNKLGVRGVHLLL